MGNLHYPVMNKEVISLFKRKGSGIFIDCTVGMGGHAGLILENIPNSKLIAVDMDDISLKIAEENLNKFGRRVKFLKMKFEKIFGSVEIKWNNVSGLLVDPGLSMYQLKNDERGFSHIINSKLDMRKDMSSELTAENVINSFSEQELSEIFEKYGDVKRAKALAKRIIERRLFEPIDTTFKLKKIIEKFFVWKPARGKSHPASKVFQALRIFVNNELQEIENFIRVFPLKLKSGSLLVFLTYHSTEDRIVKNVMKSLEREGRMKLIKPFPMIPSEEEITFNSPSRSAKLRAAESV